jgi:FixJ family two-component response regulator
MEPARHVIVVHHAPLVVEAMDVVLSTKGFTVHPAATYRDAKALLRVITSGLAAVVAHADMPGEPLPGTLLRMARSTHPEAALVVLSGRPRAQLGALPDGAVLLREPFDRSELMSAIVTACDPRPSSRIAAPDSRDRPVS